MRCRCGAGMSAVFALSSLLKRDRATTPAATHPSDLASSFFVRLGAFLPRDFVTMADSCGPYARPPVPLTFTLAFCRPHASLSRNLPPRAVSVPVPAACYLASVLLISIVCSATVYQYTESASKQKF